MSHLARWVATLRARPTVAAAPPAATVTEMIGFAWVVLALVFVDEVAAMVAFGVWGWQVGTPRWLLVVLLPLLAVAAWWLFASPKARYGSHGRREVVKVLVFGLASLALWDAGHHGWAVALLVFSIVVNGLAAHPRIRAVAAQT